MDQLEWTSGVGSSSGPLALEHSNTEQASSALWDMGSGTRRQGRRKTPEARLEARGEEATTAVHI